MRIEIRLADLVRQKAAREQRDINKNTVAQESGVPYNTVYHYWLNKVTRFDGDTLVKLCTYLECSLQDLLVFVEDEKQE